MPIEISEIAIQFKVQDGAAGAADSMPAQAGEESREAVRDGIVAECVARVLRALRAEQER